MGLLSSMAEFESNFNPKAAARGPSKDVFRRRDTNRGLLQISKQSANQPGYSCGIKKAKHLHDPAIHLPCAVKILSKWVGADHVIASYKGNKKNRGGGRYWAVLQEKNGRLPAISSFTRNLPVCRKG
ncbi:transglycosylase SLT domain-containing protein [Nitrosospira multiformis]|uniref:transglycosylase SLT domain-containing protein n=1 Tax=Nitrosospira multiformis TaxID=1231 RepID=UPI00352543F1